MKKKNDYQLKAEQGFHSNDVEGSIFRKGEKSQEDWEKELGIDGIKKSLKEHGWESWQWRVLTQKAIKKHKYSTHFVEAFSPYFHGYLRGDSKESLRDACEHILNKAQKFNSCEKKTNHNFEPKEGYSNGLLSCKHCGFWGYTNLFAKIRSDIEHYKIYATVSRNHESESREAISQVGLAFNGFGGMLIKNINEEGYSFCNSDFKLNDKFLKELWGLFIKHKLIKKKCVKAKKGETDGNN